MSSAGDRTAELRFKCLAVDKWSRYPATQDVEIACNSIQNVSSMTFCDGSVIGPDAVLFNSSEVVLNSDSITTTGRIYQELDPSSSYEAVNGYYGLAKDAYPALNPYSAGVKAITTWTQRATPADNGWQSTAWAPELVRFVAVANTGTNRVMYSSNGITWTATASAAEGNAWRSVVWAPQLGRFVAVASAGGSSRAMYSSDGNTWSLASSVPVRAWVSVCWSPELSLFVAVAADGIPDCVMTSTDGLTWTLQSGASGNTWTSVCWSPELSLFVAVANSGTGNRVMTSSDGITWVSRTSAADNNWASVCWSPELGLFAAVAGTGVNNRVMTSTDGITWTSRSTALFDFDWTSVVWSPEFGMFVAGSAGGHFMYSPNGITWRVSVNTGASLSWRGLSWSPELGIFVSVATSGVGFRVFTSSLAARPPTSYNVFDSSFNTIDQSGNWTIQQVLKAGSTTTGATPSVAGVNLLTITHTVNTTITDLTGGAVNQQVTLLINNTAPITTTINTGGNFRLAGNFVGNRNDSITLLKLTGLSGPWVEISRSINTPDT